MSSIEDAIQQAIVDRFFEPSVLFTTHSVWNQQTGNTELVTQPTQTEAPSMRVARDLWEARHGAITDAVMKRLDIGALVEDVVEKVTEEMVKRLTAPPNNWGHHPAKSERQVMLDKVYEKVAEEFGRQAVEHLRQTGGLLGILSGGEQS